MNHVEPHAENQPLAVNGELRTATELKNGLGVDSLEILKQSLLSIAGKAQGLPVDLAENHDHYLHGADER